MITGVGLAMMALLIWTLPIMLIIALVGGFFKKERKDYVKRRLDKDPNDRKGISEKEYLQWHTEKVLKEVEPILEKSRILTEEAKKYL